MNKSRWTKKSSAASADRLALAIAEALNEAEAEAENIAAAVAMALAELITRKYPKDTLDVIVFGDDARQIEIKDLPYLQVGPFHTNTVAGLELSMDILRKRKNPNKQIFL